MAEQDRANFEAHMLRLNLCTRLHRHPESAGGAYRTTTVQRAWEAWQAAIASMAAPVWQPIATAPKDGTYVLLWEMYSDHPFIGCWYADRWQVSHEHVDAKGDSYVLDTITQEWVTHWQPLASKPTPQDPPIAAKAAKETPQ